MQELNMISNRDNMIPIIVDVERNIDGHQMVRCSYFSVQSDEPLLNWKINIRSSNSPIVLLNLEAILVGSPSNPNDFKTIEDINEMYDFIEDSNEGLFVDINDIWIPVEMFGKTDIEQGMVFRIPDEQFILLWKFRNDRISIEELFSDEERFVHKMMPDLKQKPPVYFSEEETMAFQKWTYKQIEQSRMRYNENKKHVLKKIKK
ncbi:MAG: hypothetical protein ABFR05_00160 [Bacteroidota bacterium]